MAIHVYIVAVYLFVHVYLHSSFICMCDVCKCIYVGVILKEQYYLYLIEAVLLHKKDAAQYNIHMHSTYTNLFYFYTYVFNLL